MDSVSAESTAVVTKEPRPKRSETSEALSKKYAAGRQSLKLKKKKAHQRKLNGSHANG
jgi:hypothetical protein